MQMPDPVFEGCKNVTWICFSCGIPNFSTTLFETHLADSVATSLATENSYSILSDVPGKQTTSPSLGSLLSPNSYSSISLDNSIGSPQHTSSPLKPSQNQPHRPDKRKNTMRIMTVNLQSLRAKRSTFWLLLTESDPDIIIGCETWLHPGIFEREVIPVGYNIISRRDRTQDHHGGVIIIAKDGIVGSEVNIQTSIEFTAASFECIGKQPLIVGALYRPPNSNQSYIEELANNIRDLQDPQFGYLEMLTYQT
jgi:hypothetical protein